MFIRVRETHTANSDILWIRNTRCNHFTQIPITPNINLTQHLVATGSTRRTCRVITRKRILLLDRRSQHRLISEVILTRLSRQGDIAENMLVYLRMNINRDPHLFGVR